MIYIAILHKRLDTTDQLDEKMIELHNYIGDTEIALIKARQFLEVLIKILFEHYCIQTNTLSLADNIGLLYNLNVFDEEMFNKLDIIRKSGNKAVHENINYVNNEIINKVLSNIDDIMNGFIGHYKGIKNNFKDGKAFIFQRKIVILIRVINVT